MTETILIKYVPEKRRTYQKLANTYQKNEDLAIYIYLHNENLANYYILLQKNANLAGSTVILGQTNSPVSIRGGIGTSASATFIPSGQLSTAAASTSVNELENTQRK